MANAIKSGVVLPRFIVMVLDDDIIDYLSFKGEGVASVHGEMLEWLVQNINNLIITQKELLPANAVEEASPMVYWVALPSHKLFCEKERVARIKSLNMKVIKLKEIWSYDDMSLINPAGKISKLGLLAYWKAIDAAPKFNIAKREIFLAKEILRKSNALYPVRQIPEQKIHDDEM